MTDADRWAEGALMAEPDPYALRGLAPEVARDRAAAIDRAGQRTGKTDRAQRYLRILRETRP